MPHIEYNNEIFRVGEAHRGYSCPQAREGWTIAQIPRDQWPRFARPWRYDTQTGTIVQDTPTIPEQMEKVVMPRVVLQALVLAVDALLDEVPYESKPKGSDRVRLAQRGR